MFYPNMRIFLIIPVLVLVLVMTMPFSNAQSIPDWVKNTAGWWAEDAISETEFVNAIEFLVNEGIINVDKQDHAKNYAQMWLKNEINDEEFLQNIKPIKNNYFLSTIDDSTLPEWIVNNSGAISYRILGIGDIVSVVEKGAEDIDQENLKITEEKL